MVLLPFMLHSSVAFNPGFKPFPLCVRGTALTSSRCGTRSKHSISMTATEPNLKLGSYFFENAGVRSSSAGLCDFDPEVGIGMRRFHWLTHARAQTKHTHIHTRAQSRQAQLSSDRALLCATRTPRVGRGGRCGGSHNATAHARAHARQVSEINYLEKINPGPVARAGSP